MAAAMGSSMRYTSRAPADSADSFTARFSTSVIPKGTQMMMRGFTSVRRLCARAMKYRSIASVISKSAMTPSRRGRTARMFPGVRPSISFASRPTASTLLPPREGFWTATTEEKPRTRDDPLALHVDEGVRGPEIDRRDRSRTGREASRRSWRERSLPRGHWGGIKPRAPVPRGSRGRRSEVAKNEERPLYHRWLPGLNRGGRGRQDSSPVSPSRSCLPCAGSAFGKPGRTS